MREWWNHAGIDASSRTTIQAWVIAKKRRSRSASAAAAISVGIALVARATAIERPKSWEVAACR